MGKLKYVLAATGVALASWVSGFYFPTKIDRDVEIPSYFQGLSSEMEIGNSNIIKTYIEGTNDSESVFYGGMVVENSSVFIKNETQKVFDENHSKSVWIKNNIPIDAKTTAEEVSESLDDEKNLGVYYYTEKRRLQNQVEYYKYIQERYSEFEPYLKEGKYTELTPEIQELSNELWNNSYFYPYDPVKDYVHNILLWYSKNIREPETNEEKRIVKWRVSAKKVLELGFGYCDEADVLVKSLLIDKGIPTKIRVIEGYDEENNLIRHAYPEAWLENNGKYEWVVVEPRSGSVAGIGKRINSRKEKDITSLISGTYMGDAEKW